MSSDDNQRVKCCECKAMILPGTASDNGGLCAHCFKVPSALLIKRREFDRQISSGEIFVPSAVEISSAIMPDFFMRGTTVWEPEAEFYVDSSIRTADQALVDVRAIGTGDVYLTAGEDIWLILTFNETYGVCYYENNSDSDFRYARTSSNATRQVDGNLQLVQGCSCCGVGMHWFPSRYHMNRHDAFSVMQAVIRREPNGHHWMISGDFTYTQRGNG